jgi:hypothetical protein
MLRREVAKLKVARVKVGVVWEQTWDLGPLAFSSGRVHGRRPVRWSETFNHPDIAVSDLAQYGKVATVR